LDSKEPALLPPPASKAESLTSSDCPTCEKSWQRDKHDSHDSHCHCGAHSLEEHEPTSPAYSAESILDLAHSLHEGMAMAEHPVPQQAPQHYHPPPQSQPQQHAQWQPQYSPAVKPDVLALQHRQSLNQAADAFSSQTPPQASAQAGQVAPVVGAVRAHNETMSAWPQGQSPAPAPANTQQNGSATPQSANQGFKSPVMRTLPDNQQHEAEVNELKQLMAKSRPEAVRHAVRDMFDKTLVGSDYHSSFIVCYIPLTGTPTFLVLVTDTCAPDSAIQYFIKLHHLFLQGQ
jgi:hypothetical protein